MSIDFFPTSPLKYHAVYKDAETGKFKGLKFEDKPADTMPKSDRWFSLENAKGHVVGYEDDKGGIFFTGFGVTGGPDARNRCDKIIYQISKKYNVPFVDEYGETIDQDYISIYDDFVREARREAREESKRVPSQDQQFHQTGEPDLTNQIMKML